MIIVGWDKFKELETLVDIRPAHEYVKSYIPGAISLPFPIDLKKLKKDYGTSCYGLDAERILHYVVGYRSYVGALKSKECIGLYCFNGGLRSHLLSKILEYPIASIQLRCVMGNRKALSGSLRNIRFLDGGFSTYLDNFHDHFKVKYPFIKICGLTGSGKTKILREIHNLGGQTIDLEKLAKHSGSVFGGIAQGIQPNQWDFEQKLIMVLESLDLNQPVFIEEKGSGIGSLHIPTELFYQMEQAPKIFLEVTKSVRVTNLVENYGVLHEKDLNKAITQIAVRLGTKREKKALEALKADNKEECAAILLDYYDQTAVYSQQNGQKIVFTTVGKTAQTVLDIYKTLPVSNWESPL